MESIKSNHFDLTEDEQAAKDFLYRLSIEADNFRCDEDLKNFELDYPTWYDAEKCKRGQQYFAKNRSGIFGSHMMGLITLLTQNKGLEILCATGRSGTPDTARKRYASTVLTTLSWYEADLTPGSTSWKSLMRVRKLHLNASRMGESKKLGFITQMEMVITQFGFMGFTLIRPQLFDLSVDDEQDIEAFLHLWAVIGFLLGIMDEFNLCLLPINTTRRACEIILRYFMLPAIQLQTQKCKNMIQALIDGFKPIVPFMSYDIQMFLTKRTNIVPGYQYELDPETETLSRSLFSEEFCQKVLELRFKTKGYEYMKFILFTKIPIYEFTPKTTSIEINGNMLESKRNEFNDSVVEGGIRRSMDAEFARELREYLGLDESTNITLKLIDYETEWKQCLNDSKFLELDDNAQGHFRIREKLRKVFKTRLGRYVMDWLFTLLMWRFKRVLNST